MCRHERKGKLLKPDKIESEFFDSKNTFFAKFLAKVLPNARDGVEKNYTGNATYMERIITIVN